MTAALTDHDLYLFNEGSHHRLYLKLGAHPEVHGGRAGARFAVWAPNAREVAVVGDFNGWTSRDRLTQRGVSGIWEGFVPGAGPGALYKYRIVSHAGGRVLEKADPVGFRHEVPPKTASVVCDLAYEWGDADWMKGRKARTALDAPISVYEVHLGSWRRSPEHPDRPLGYREIAEPLADHVAELGFTHVELMPVMAHPFAGSWGYQLTGYFAPAGAQGGPQDLMHLIDVLHRRGIGVILDWVPSHFATDEHGLALFDGTHLYEHADPRQGFHPDWGSFIFNYGRSEVRSFLTSSALFWMDKYHVDGLRVDGVASMLYLDYSRKKGQWIPNRYGGRENLEAIDFLRRFNEAFYREYPDGQTIAEESTAWPMVSRPTDAGGLGFGMKWDMGWMHDTLEYMKKDPVHRKHHQGLLTFRGLYAGHENFMLPLSHDEVVHGKGSLAGRMPGDDWQKLANLRLLYAWMYAQNGKKLLFMGAELAQWAEWSHERSLDWHLLEYERHRGVRDWLRDLNALYRKEPALWRLDYDPQGLEWIAADDADQSVLCLLRRGKDGDAPLLCAFNFTPVPRERYRVGVPRAGRWFEIANSDAPAYGGGGVGNPGAVEAEAVPWHGRARSLALTLPPLGAIVLRPEEVR